MSVGEALAALAAALSIVLLFYFVSEFATALENAPEALGEFWALVERSYEGTR